MKAAVIIDRVRRAGASEGLCHLLARAAERLRRDRVHPATAPAGVDLRAQRVVVLAGPGVVRDGCVDGLRALAAAGNLPVANTWGAKGVFAWDSPHHMGTCGLQERDFKLLGFGGYDIILSTGIDPAESPRERFALASVVEVEPAALAALAHAVEPYPEPLPPNELYSRLAAIAQPGYTDDRFPRHPARAVADLRAVLGPGALLTADPGLAGLWVARTFATTEPGSVVVPATAEPGLAAAIALAGALDDRHAIAVTHAPVDEWTAAITELAAKMAARFRLEVWGDEIDPSPTRALVEAAGPVVAWGGRLRVPAAER
jgi:hypothetical protein